MKIFVAYGYNPRDQWIPQLVFPIIKAFGAEVVTGEQTWGGTISSELQTRIASSDALIGFTTRRGGRWWRMPDSTYETHRWVIEEIAIALRSKPPIPILEVRETKVSTQGGITGDRQRITYDERKRDECLVELVQAIGSMTRGARMDLLLLPESFIAGVRPFLERPGFRCIYWLLQDGKENGYYEAKILRKTGALYLSATRLPLDACIKIRVEAAGFSWSSEYEPLNARPILLEREGAL